MGGVSAHRSRRQAKEAGQAPRDGNTFQLGQSRQSLISKRVDLEDITTGDLESVLPEERLNVPVRTEGGEPRPDYGLEEDITTGDLESLPPEEGLDVLVKTEGGEPRPDSTALPDFYLF
ncbi:hypothetical protein MY10362_007337 [Beauveria mimosiformis]